MDREKLITIGIGLLVGIVAAGAYFAFSKYLPTLQNLPNKVTFAPQPEISTQQSKVRSQLELALDDHIATTESPLRISGRAEPGAKIILFANAEEKIASAGANGDFSTDLKLEEGENEISITAFDTSGTATIIKRNVTLEISP